VTAFHLTEREGAVLASLVENPQVLEASKGGMFSEAYRKVWLLIRTLPEVKRLPVGEYDNSPAFKIAWRIVEQSTPNPES